MTADKVFAFIKSIGVNTSLSLTFILSLIVLAILLKPTLNWFDNCSPTVLILLLLRWSISSTSTFEFTSDIKLLIIETISSLVKTILSSGILSFNLELILNLPTWPRLYLWSEKNSFSIIPLAVSSSGASALLNCL